MHCSRPSDDREAWARDPWVRLGLLVVAVAAGTGVLWWRPLDGDTMRQAVSSAGAWGYLAFVAAYSVATLLLLPKNLLSVVAGALFGVWTGTVLVWVSAMLGSGAAFWLGRSLGRDGVRRLVGRRLDRLDRLLDRHGALAVLVARLVPVLPFTAVNYGSGVTGVRFLAYLSATAVGIVPGTVAYVVLGAYGSTPGAWPFVLSVVTLLALALTGLVAGFARRRRRA